MCDFFSATSDGKGNILYFDNEIRKRILKKELNFIADSHTSINHYYGFKGADEDSRNKYEFNPLTKKFTIDRINSLDDSKEVERKIRALDFSTIVPELRIKPIIHPFKVKPNEVTDKDIQNLHKWASVWDSVGASVWDSVGASVWDSVGDSVKDSVGDSVKDSVWDSVGDSVWAPVWAPVWASVRAPVWAPVWASVRAPVGGSVWASVRASAGAYVSSFFNIEKWKNIDHEPFNNPYQCLINLWERGFVPSFDGATWRLHSGDRAEIVYSEVAVE